MPVARIRIFGRAFTISRMDLYETLLIAHVSGVLVWLGGTLTMLMLWRRTVAVGDHRAIVAQADAGRWFELRLALPASAIVLLAGGWLMTEGNWGMDQGWLHFGMAGVFLASAVALLGTARSQKRIATEGVSARLTSLITWGMVITLGITVVALWAMIVKPWS